MNKKSFISLLLVMCLAIVATACGTNNAGTPADAGKDGESNQKIALKLWYWNGAISDTTIEAAKEKFPNIDLQAEKLPSGGDYLTKLKTTLSGGGSGPDIVAMDSWVATMLPYKEKFVNLYDHGARDVQPQYLDWKWKMAADNDDKYLIGMPIDVAPVVLYYRTDLFEQAGISTDPEQVKGQVASWDDYLALLKKVKDATGTTTTTLDEIFRNIMGQSSTGYFDTDGNYIGDQEHVKKAWDYAIKAYEEGLTLPYANISEYNAFVNSGKISAFISASWAVGDLISGAPDTSGKWHIAYPPGGVGNQGGSFFGALSSTKYPQEAYEVIQFLVSPENLITAYKEFGNYPSTPEVYNKPEMENKSEFFGGQDLSAVFADAAKDVQVSPTDPRDDMVGTSLTEALTRVDLQKSDPEEAWASAQEKIKRQLSL